MGYRYVTRPVTLTVASGSLDGDAVRFLTAIAGRLASTGSTIRLKVVDAGTSLNAAKSFAAGTVDLAVARADSPDMSAARTVVLFTYGVVVIIAPSGSTIEDVDDLKGKTVGLIGGESNRGIVQVLFEDSDPVQKKTTFLDLSVADAPQAFAKKQVQAMLVVMPMTERYLTILRSVVHQGGGKKAKLIPIESADAIAAVARSYESYELPKGTLRGAPPIPEDDLTTLRVPFYLVAKAKLPADVVGDLTAAIMDTHRDLLADYPQLAQIAAPSTDKDAFIPVHPGAAAYYDGERKTFFDKFGDQIFYGSMLLGSLTSVLAAAWNFMLRDPTPPPDSPLQRLCDLAARIRDARSEADLEAVGDEVDDILLAGLSSATTSGADSVDAAALSAAAQRLDHLIERRKSAFRGRAGSAARG